MRAAIVLIVVVAIATVLFALFGPISAEPPGASQDLLFFATNLLNCLSILWLFILMYRTERADDAAFGKAMRDNAAVILMAGLTMFVFSASALLGDLFPGRLASGVSLSSG